MQQSHSWKLFPPWEIMPRKTRGITLDLSLYLGKDLIPRLLQSVILKAWQRKSAETPRGSPRVFVDKPLVIAQRWGIASNSSRKHQDAMPRLWDSSLLPLTAHSPVKVFAHGVSQSSANLCPHTASNTALDPGNQEETFLVQLDYQLWLLILRLSFISLFDWKFFTPTLSLSLTLEHWPISDLALCGLIYLFVDWLCYGPVTQK